MTHMLEISGFLITDKVVSWFEANYYNLMYSQEIVSSGLGKAEEHFAVTAR